MPSSYQQTAGPSKATKFVNSNPLDPMLRPFSISNASNDDHDLQASELADKVNQRLENDRRTAPRNVAPMVNSSAAGDNAYQQPVASAAAAAAAAASLQQKTPNLKCEAPRQVKTKQSNHEHDSDNNSDDDSWLDDDDNQDDPVLEAIRQRRLRELQSQHDQRIANIAKGHGELRIIAQDDFIPECTSSSSEYVVVHFCHDEYQRCHILNHHLKLLAPLHVECKFLQLNATKAPFFVTKLNVRTLPTLIVFRHGQVVDRMTGFDKIVASDNKADVDDWKTSRLQEWLASTGAINYTSPMKEHDEGGDRVGYRSRIYRGTGESIDDDC
ncbi:hypothetical protein MPSEU_000410200 [Mayamaea pseudoterrestris]|nr:hypothetical protein MPSEU_000410200 [Mayamaea pseudoterrestris]